MLIINVSTPNDHLGDYLRDSFVKVNANFAELADAVALKAPTNNPAFTGLPTAPTPTAGTNNTQIATTAFVMANGGGSPIYWTAGGGSQAIKTTNGGSTATGANALATGVNCQANGARSFVGGTNAINNGTDSIVYGSGSTANANGVFIFGNGITGATANTTYVNQLNIDYVAVGSITDALGVDANGRVVRAESPMIRYREVILYSWSKDKQYTISTGLSTGTIISIDKELICTTANAGFSVGDIVTTNSSEPNDSGGTGGHGIGLQYKPTTISSFKVNVEDNIFIPSAWTSDSSGVGDTIAIGDTSQWAMRFLMLYYV